MPFRYAWLFAKVLLRLKTIRQDSNCRFHAVDLNQGLLRRGPPFCRTAVLNIGAVYAKDVYKKKSLNSCKIGNNSGWTPLDRICDFCVAHGTNSISLGRHFLVKNGSFGL
jgi:hypothetical protein